MPLPIPQLDDRSFDELLEEARRRIRQSTPEWENCPPMTPAWCWSNSSRT